MTTYLPDENLLQTFALNHELHNKAQFASPFENRMNAAIISSATVASPTLASLLGEAIRLTEGVQ
jgi:hypothetical protein